MAEYPPFAVSADAVVFTLREGRLAILLVERLNDPYRGRLALPGGFVEPDEDAEAAALRELREETGVVGGYIEQLRTYSAPERDPRMRVVTVAHMVLMPFVNAVAGDDAAAVRLVDVDDLHMDDLAFDHAVILADALERLRSKVEYTDIASGLLPGEFTIDQLLDVYKAVWGTRPDPANFRRKMLRSGVIVASGGRARTGGRPALLYRVGGHALLNPPLTRLSEVTQ